MASEVEICNLALSHIGAYSINALSDASQEARKCNLYFDSDRDFVLRDYPWNFAEKRNLLAVLSGVTPYGYTYAYAYPTDCVNALYLFNSANITVPLEFKITAKDDLSGKQILTDEEDAVLVYTARVEDPTLFDANFIVAFSYKLAASLALTLTKKESVQERMLRIYAAIMAMAKTNNAIEQKNTTFPTNPFISARS